MSAARAAARELLDLPTDALGLVLYQLTLAHDIAAVAPTCHQLCDAAKIAMKARPFSSEVVTLAGHTQPVVGVAAATDGRVITGAWDSSLKIWRDGVCERTIQAHINDVNAVAVLPGGERFVSGSDDQKVKLWTLDGALDLIFELESIVLCLTALPDGVHFVVGLGGGPNESSEVRLYHVDGTLVHSFKGHTAAVWVVAVTRDGQNIISGAYDGLVKVWSVASKSLVSTCICSSDVVRARGEVFAVAAMPDGQRILSGGSDKTVRVHLLDGTLKNTFTLHTFMVRALVALPDNQHALSGSSDNTVKLFNVDDGAVLRTFRHRTNDVRSLALLPDGLRFVHGAADNTARIAYHGLAPIKA